MSLYQDYTISAEGFSPADTAVVLDAGQKWVTALGGGLGLTPTERCPNQANAICVYPKSLKPGMLLAFTDRRWNIFAGDPPIRIYIDLVDYTWTPEAISHVAQHEIGHALGLKHTGKGTVMYHASATNVTVQTDGAQNVTCADVAQFGELRGFHAMCSEAK